MKAAPLVSVGLPVYNGGRYLPECLDSLLAQTLGDFEVIISDNASTDATEEICRAFAARDSRVRYFRNPENLGAAPNYDRTFHLSSGRYFKWAAHDDVLDPTYLERCVEILEADPEAVGAHSWTQLIDLDSKPLIYDPQNQAFVDSRGRLWGLAPDTNGVGRQAPTERDQAVARFRGVIQGKRYDSVFGVYRRDIMAKSCLHLPFWGSDKTFVAEMSLHNKIRMIPEMLFLRRCHPSQAGALPFKDKAGWLVAKGRAKATSPQLMALRAYNDVIARAPINAYDRFRCRMIVLRQAFRLNKWTSSSYLGVGSLLSSLLSWRSESATAPTVGDRKG